MKKKVFTPALFDCLKHYSGRQFTKDLVSGVIVAIIALPLSIALALASGVSPEQGIYTAIIAGFLISFFGGSCVQIAGPTAAFATIVAGIVAQHGMGGLALATVMAGVILILMGVLRLGSLIRFIPYTITTGFTAGIAVTIFIGQWKDFFGVTYADKPIETMEKAACFFRNLGTVNVWAVLVGTVCLAILILWPKVNRLIPGSLIAVLVGIAMVQLLKLPVNTIGVLYTISNRLPSFTLPDFSFSTMESMISSAFTIAILAAIESLLSCVVADGMVATHHNSNTELIAQGIGNIGSALFGGIPATGAIARTAANIKSGGRTPVAGMVHALVLVLVLVVLMPYAALIPMPCIAAILFSVAYNMSQWRAFVRLCRCAPRSDLLVLVLTFLLTVIFDLVVAIEVGMLLAALLFMKRMSDETEIRGWKYKDMPEDQLTEVPLHVRVYEIRGPLFFGMAERIGEITVKEFTRCLVIRMHMVNALDVTAFNALEDLYDECAKKGIRVIFSHVNEQPMHVMEHAGFVDKVGRENFCRHIQDAIALAAQSTGEQAGWVSPIRGFLSVALRRRVDYNREKRKRGAYHDIRIYRHRQHGRRAGAGAGQNGVPHRHLPQQPHDGQGGGAGRGAGRPLRGRGDHRFLLRLHLSGRKTPSAAGRAGAAASDPDGAGGQAPAGVHGGGRDHRGHRAGRARQRRGADHAQHRLRGGRGLDAVRHKQRRDAAAA